MEIAMNLKTVLALAITAAFAAPVAAQTSSGADKPTGAPSAERPAAGATAPGGFADVDKNKDNYISRDEAKGAAWENRFTELDKDNDNRLSQSEFDAMQGAAGATGAAPGATGAAPDKPAQKQ
jgi:hypothetical protein